MRLFIAAPIPDDVKDELVRLAQSVCDKDALVCTPVRRDAMHLTLRFLGEVDKNDVPSLIKALSAVKVAPIKTALAGIGTFPDMTHPRVVWVGLEDERAIGELAAHIRGATAAFGKADDYPFAAHLTLCRVKAVKDAKGFAAAMRTQINRVPFTIDHIELVESTLAREGPTYMTIWSSRKR